MATEARFPDSERPRLRRAIADLEDAHIAKRRPNLHDLAPAGPWRVPYLLALIPYDMRYLLRVGCRAEAALETYLNEFPELMADPDTVAQLAQEEHDAEREAAPPSGGTGETTQYNPRARFGYRDRFPDLWPRLFPHVDTSRLPEPGERIGDWYRVERRTGHGGMGVVFECYDERLKRRVAVKVLNPQSPRSQDPLWRERFLREAESLAKVDHPNVVRIHSAGLVGNRGHEAPYFAMEYLEGGTLESRFRAKLGPAEALGIARGIAAGLKAIHDKGMAHRDVNPRNVMFRADGEPVLLDLGLVRSSEGSPRLTETGVSMGTPHYVAPEQASGLSSDCRSDVYSLGCILYRAVTGQLPGDQFAGLMGGAETDHRPALEVVDPAVPPRLAALIARMMARRPEERPQTADEVLAELNSEEILVVAASPGMPIDDRVAVRPDAGVITPRPGRWWGVVGGVVTVGLAAVVGSAAFLDRGCATHDQSGSSSPTTRPGDGPPPTPNPFRGRVDAQMWRKREWVPLIDVQALPLKIGDHFKVEVEIDPPAYLYVFWIEPDGESAPLYPWDPAKGWGSRPATEKVVPRLSLPETKDFEPDPKKLREGVTTLVVFARPDRLPQTDREIELWFKELPPIERGKGDSRAVVWFDNYAPVRGKKDRAPKVVGPIDPYERWQVELKRRVGDAAAFQTAVSFAQGND